MDSLHTFRHYRSCLDEVTASRPSSQEPSMIGWHRLFGLGLTDLFSYTGYVVELEKDLSIRKQLLDAILIERAAVASLPDPPDGLEDLAAHNLLTYKSHQEALDDFALDELLGHYVNYRKQITPKDTPLLPIEHFRLLAVCTRFPEKLARQVTLTPLKKGVYTVQWGVRSIRIIVLSAVEPAPHNALWELFSAVPSRVRQGREFYHWRQKNLSSVLESLYDKYQVEGMSMSYTVEDYVRDYHDELLAKTPREKLLKLLNPEERLRGLPPEDRVKGLPPEDRVKGLPPEERLKGLPPEDRVKGLPPEERLRGLAPRQRLAGLTQEELLELAKQLNEMLAKPPPEG